MIPDWRTRHCVEPAAERVSEVLGRDVWSDLGGCPRSPREAAQLYRRLGVTCLKDAVTKVLGPPCDKLQAMRGDICMVDNALGICRGEWVECLDRMQPLSRVECAWHVRG